MLQKLNYDTILYIFNFLDTKDKIKFMLTCHDLLNIKHRIKINNMYDYCLIKDSIFLSSFKNISYRATCINIPNNITHLYFSDSFNKPLPKLNEFNCFTNNLKFIKFGWNFNQPIHGCIPNSVTHLIFGNRFNQDISGCIPENVVYLEFGTSFNKSIKDCLPKKLKYLKFGFNFNQNIDKCIPDVKYLEFGHNFNQVINNCCINKKYGLPSSLKYLIFKQEFNQSINGCIPHGVKVLKFGKKFNQKIRNQLPTTLKYLSVCNPQGKEYNILCDLPASVNKINLVGYYTDEFTKLFKKNVTIQIGDEFITYLKQISDRYKTN
uniref:Putative F-box and FNIP repeat-containing protein n=1 Tax=Moumouvirus sp. 'Monve' TaxID=1128131 RepID=H2EDE6_9VIRU|nr:putative F-box and FNIP repeat-containing protein [Moumouvirus Monve]